MEAMPSGNGKPRLFIKEMVLDNFKSYAGKQFIGPFHKVNDLTYLLLVDFIVSSIFASIKDFDQLPQRGYYHYQVALRLKRL